MRLKNTLLQFVLKYLSLTFFIILSLFIWSFIENQKDIFFNLQFPILVKIKLLSFSLPWMISLAVPMAVFISSLFFFKTNWINKNDPQLDFFYKNILFPFYIIILPMTIFMSYFNSQILPEGNHTASQYFRSVRQLTNSLDSLDQIELNKNGYRGVREMNIKHHYQKIENHKNQQNKTIKKTEQYLEELSIDKNSINELVKMVKQNHKQRIEEKLKGILNSEKESDKHIKFVNIKRVIYAANTKSINIHLMEIHKKFMLSFLIILIYFFGAFTGVLLYKSKFLFILVIPLTLFAYWFITITSEYYIYKQSLSPFVGMWLANFLLTIVIIIQGYILKMKVKIL